MEARLVNALRRHQARAAHELAADCDAGQRVAPGKLLALGDRQYCRHDDRAGMHRPAFEGVVEVFAVRRRAIHERRAAAIERARVADGRARARAFPALQRREHALALSRSHAKAGDVDHELLRRLAKFTRALARRVDSRCERFRDGRHRAILRKRVRAGRNALTISSAARKLARVPVVACRSVGLGLQTFSILSRATSATQFQRIGVTPWSGASSKAAGTNTAPPPSGSGTSSPKRSSPARAATATSW